MVKWTAVFILSLLPAVVWADEQMPSSERVRVGGRLSLDANMVGGPGTNDDFISYSARAGFSAGGVAQLRVWPFLAAQMELSFSTRGTDYRSETMGDGALTMSYLELPVLLQMSLPNSSGAVPHVLLGPSISLQLDAENAMPDGRVIDISNRVERMDAGLLIGVGASVGLGGTGALIFDVRYYWGLRNINEIAASEDDELTHEVLYFAIGYQADLSIFSGGR